MIRMMVMMLVISLHVSVNCMPPLCDQSYRRCLLPSSQALFGLTEDQFSKQTPIQSSKWSLPFRDCSHSGSTNIMLYALSEYWVFSKIGGTPQIIHFNRVFHYKPSILEYHYVWKHPFVLPLLVKGSIWWNMSFHTWHPDATKARSKRCYKRPPALLYCHPWNAVNLFWLFLSRH